MVIDIELRGRPRLPALAGLAVLLLAALGLLATPSRSSADERFDASWDEFKSGRHVLLVRHALAPGTGDPKAFRLRDCTTQRNLDERGREQARHIGAWLRQRGVEAAAVYSSQWCRCLETARLMAVGPVNELPALNSFYEMPETREANLRALEEFIATLPERRSPTVLVTHQVTISALTGEYAASGEGVLVERGGGPRYRVLARIAFED